jgi:hypothetical protein
MYNVVPITLIAPTLFDHQNKQRYYVTLEEAEMHRAEEKTARLAAAMAQNARPSFHHDFNPRHQ